MWLFEEAEYFRFFMVINNSDYVVLIPTVFEWVNSQGM